MSCLDNDVLLSNVLYLGSHATKSQHKHFDVLVALWSSFSLLSIRNFSALLLIIDKLGLFGSNETKKASSGAQTLWGAYFKKKNCSKKTMETWLRRKHWFLTSKEASEREIILWWNKQSKKGRFRRINPVGCLHNDVSRIEKEKIHNLQHIKLWLLEERQHDHCIEKRGQVLH